MKVRQIALLSDVINGSEIILPENLLAKSVVLTNPESLDNGNFLLAYNEENKTLELRYMEHDCYCDDYWGDQDVGELVNHHSENLDERIEELDETGTPYFLVATYRHSYEFHYLVNSRKEIYTCPWDTGISGIFIPSALFIEECGNNKELMMDRLKGYFEEYSNYCNGEVYILCKDIYQLSSEKELIEIEDSDSCGGFIGYNYAKESLTSYF